MAITQPNTTPAQYAEASVSRAGLLTSGLNIVNVIAMSKFIEKYNYVPYVMVNELAGNIEKSDNKEVRWYESHGRYMGFVSANAAVSVSAGAAATITVGTGSYSLSGTESLPTAGLIFYNSRTGVEGRVSSPNKSTPYAHTFVLTPVNAADNVSVLAGDQLLNRGQKYLGEGSTKTETIIRNIDRYSNYNTELRKDSTLTDLALAERIEFAIDGQHYFTYKQKRDDDMSLLLEREYLIMESTQTDNLGYSESGSNGVIKQVEANGINGTFSNWGIQTTLAAQERALSAVGAPKEYDILADKTSYINMQNAFFNTVNNGAIIYSEGVNRNGIDLSLNFQSVSVYGRKYNLTNYQLFDEAQMYGSSGNGLRNNFMLMIPVGKTQAMDANGQTVTVPRFCVTYQNPAGGGMKWHTANTGLFASTPTSTTAESVYTTIGYFGSKVYGASQYMIMRGE